MKDIGSWFKKRFEGKNHFILLAFLKSPIEWGHEIIEDANLLYIIWSSWHARPPCVDSEIIFSKCQAAFFWLINSDSALYDPNNLFLQLGNP